MWLAVRGGSLSGGADDVTGLAFDIQWLPRAAGEPPERESFGAVRITAGGEVLTELSDGLTRTVRSEAHLSVVHMARWFAGSWWRLRWEPEATARSTQWRLSHELAGAGGGFAWPPLRFTSDGETIRVSVVRDDSAWNRPRSLVRYLAERSVNLAATSFERGVDALLETVLERLAARAAPDRELAELWRLVREERADPTLSRFRRREALFGLDPDEEDPAALSAQFAAGAWMGEAAWDEVIAASPGQPLEGVAQGLDALRRRPGTTLDLQALERGVAGVSGSHVGAVPWQRGVRLARALRAGLGLGDGPLPNARLSELLAVRETDLARPPASGFAFAVGFRDPARFERVRWCARSRHPKGRRFELARLLGEALMAGHADTGLPATDRGTARQKAQRAFAQELLCPEAALGKQLPLPRPTEDDVADVAERYDVSEQVVMSALLNYRLVPRDHFKPMGR